MPVPLLALGPHIFEIFPLNLQKLEDELTLNWPAVQRFGVGPARQFTGVADETLKIEGLAFNEEFGGYAEYLILKETARMGLPVEMISWGGGGAFGLVNGPVVVTRIGATHEMLGPDGIGRKITFGLDVAMFGGGSALGGLF